VNAVLDFLGGLIAALLMCLPLAAIFASAVLFTSNQQLEGTVLLLASIALIAFYSKKLKGS
jgi:ABC-type uncharacterized transport system permease subunit